MPLWSLTEEKIEDLKRQKLQKEKELEDLNNTEILNIWRDDLEKILVELDKIHEKELKVMMKTKDKIVKGKKDNKPKKKKTNQEDAKIPPPKKDRSKKLYDDEKKNKKLTDIINKKKETTSSKDSTNDNVSSIDDLPLVERVKIK